MISNSSSSSIASGSIDQASGGAFSSPFTSQLNFNLPLKLDRNNFPLWRAQVLPAVRAYNLEDFIFESKLAPPKFTEAISSESDPITQQLSKEFWLGRRPINCLYAG
ncbi:hypothetical protein ACOSQ3_023981 [Xanthoceras sorbifolium]